MTKVLIIVTGDEVKVYSGVLNDEQLRKLEAKDLSVLEGLTHVKFDRKVKLTEETNIILV